MKKELMSEIEEKRKELLTSKNENDNLSHDFKEMSNIFLKERRELMDEIDKKRNELIAERRSVVDSGRAFAASVQSLASPWAIFSRAESQM